ncbi:hypothetical protein ScalyP_jg1908, partial [Parmales sp. scaly parma]
MLNISHTGSVLDNQNDASSGGDSCGDTRDIIIDDNDIEIDIEIEIDNDNNDDKINEPPPNHPPLLPAQARDRGRDRATCRGCAPCRGARRRVRILHPSIVLSLARITAGAVSCLTKKRAEDLAGYGGGKAGGEKGKSE